MLTSQIFALTALGMTALAAPSTINLRSDDVVLYGKGRYQIMKRSELEDIEAYRNNGTIPPKPAYLDPNVITATGASNAVTTDKHVRSTQKRWSDSTIIIRNPDSRFLGWSGPFRPEPNLDIRDLSNPHFHIHITDISVRDVLMSQVTKGGPTPTRIFVSSGYDVANSIAVGTSVDVTLIKDFLSASGSIDYTQTWTSTQSQQFSAEVPEGKYGAFVSNPWTNRKSGNVFQGVIGSEGTLSYYQADSYDAKAFSQMNWVDGVISLCIGDEFPLKRCLGGGTL